MAKTITVDLELKYKEAVKDLDEFQKEYEDLQKQVQKENKKTAESTKELGAAADKATGGMISSFKGVVGSIGGVVKSLNTVKGALIATGIGAFVVVVTSLVSAFKSSEEGQNKFARLMGQIGVVVGNVKDVIANFGEGLLSLGGVFKKFFAGDFKGALEEGKNAFKGFTDSIKNFGDETRAELKVADEIAAKIAKANKAERELIVARAKANREIANLREQSVNKEEFTAEQRIKFLQKAGDLELQITKREIEAAKLRRDAKIAENSLSKSTKEDLDEEARLQAEVINLETARISKQRELTSQIIAFKAELNALNAADAKAAEDGVAFQEQQRIEFDKYVDLEKESIDELTDYELQDMLKKYEQQKMFEQQKFEITQNALGALANLAGQNSKFGKGLAIVQGIRDTYAGANKALASAPPPFNFVAAATVIAGGLANVKNILSTKEPQPPGFARGASSGGVSVSAPAAPAPPSFNVVGTSGTNQLADAISGQQQKPMKAFVVASEVSTAQSLERNIVKGASI